MLTAGSGLIALLGSLGLAQNTTGGHKGHHESGYVMTKMPAPKLMTGIGTSTLQITTKSKEAQAYFTQGLELLHCFWDFEAYRAFKEAARLDSSAPMAYWGIVQSLSDYKAMSDEKDAALAKIKDLMTKASDHEQFYLRAQQKQQEDEGSDDYQREMEALIDRYPDDLDAKLFLAINLRYGYDSEGRPRKGALYPLAIVRAILVDHPYNAAANHYLIHVLEDGPHAAEALPAANKLGGLAPNSGHMVHMPGHIYYKLGDQEKARDSFLASMQVDEAYMQREKVKPIDDWNYAHNLSYLIASDAEAGRFAEATAMAARLDQLPAHPFLALGKPLHAVTIGAATARLYLRYGMWQQVIDHPIGLGDAELAGAAARGYRDGVLAYARGMLALDKKQFDTAAHEADALDALQWRLKSEQTNEGDEDGGKPDRVLDLLETYSLDLRGNLRCATNHFDEGVQLIEKAAKKETKDIGYNEPPQFSRPELESLGYAFLHAGRYDKAREQFQAELKTRPQSGHALYGIALCYESAGQREEAISAYREFLDAWKNADSDLPMVQHARTATN